MLKVEGKEFLRRETGSKAIVNTDSNGLKAAKNAKRRILQEQQARVSLETRVDKLEKMIEDLINE